MSTARPLPSATTWRCSRDRELVEGIPELLGRLDEAIGNALNHGIVTNEISGRNFRLAPSKVRKRR
jgi:hypothetical protein